MMLLTSPAMAAIWLAVKLTSQARQSLYNKELAGKEICSIYISSEP